MKNVNRIKYLTFMVSALFPAVAFAATQQKLSDVIGTIAGYLNIALDLMMGLAVLMFVWYVIQYFILKADSKRSEAAQYIMWSLIGFFVILSMWGLINILLSTFNLGDNNPNSWSEIQGIFPSH